MVVYGQLVLENAPRRGIPDALLDSIFNVLVRELGEFALGLHNKGLSTAGQRTLCLRMIRKPAVDLATDREIWEQHVVPLADGYRMAD